MIEIGNMFGLLITLFICLPIIRLFFKLFCFRDPVMDGMLLAKKGVLLNDHDGTEFGIVRFSANRIFHKVDSIHCLSGPYKVQAKICYCLLKR